MSAERADASPCSEGQGDEWNRLTDLGVATIAGAQLRDGCESGAIDPNASLSGILRRRSVGRSIARREGRERQPAERHVDSHWTVETVPLGEDQIELNNRRAMELSLRCLIIRVRGVVEQYAGDEVRAMICIRTMLKERNDERVAKRLPPYQITPGELYRLASQKSTPAEPVQDTLF